jgi:Spy/CpxP family protein refolding chaperone
MKTPFLCLLFAVASLVTVSADSTTTTTPATAAPSATQQQRAEKFKAALEKLNLTDAQKDQIKQIRASVTDRRERRQQIMAVLTPDQKEKLKEMIKERWEATQSGATAGAN